MKHTRKILIALLVVMTLLVGMFAINASAADTPATVYLSPNSNWKSASARFAARFWNDGGDEAWVDMTDADGDGIYECEVPSGMNLVIFCRMNPSATTNNWDNKWNQTGDLTIPTDGTNCFTVPEGAWDGSTTTWSTYTPSTCEHVYGTNGKCINDGCDAGHTYTIAGTIVSWGWDPTNESEMTYADGIYTQVLTNVAEGDYKFKCVQDHDGNWGVAYPDADYELTVASAGSTVTITLDTTTTPYTVNAVVVASSHKYNIKTTTATCTEAGTATHTCDGTCGVEGCTASYTAEEAALGHSYAANGVCSVETCGNQATLTVAGSSSLCGVEWLADASANDMTYNEDTGLWSITYVNKTGADIDPWPQYKICLDHSFDTCWGGAAAGLSNTDNAYVEFPAYSILTISFNLETKTITTSVVACEHTYSTETGLCSVCSSEWSIPEVLAAADGTKVVVSGHVLSINTIYSESNDNISLTITDGENKLYIYRLKGNYEIGDKITVTGEFDVYYGSYQIAAGATAVEDEEAHVDTYDYVEKSISDALDADDDTNVIITGTVVEIDTEYDSKYNNMSVYIQDAAGNKIYIYRLAGQVTLCDEITVKGSMATYKENRQVVGCTFTASEAKKHTYGAYNLSSCCSVCGAANALFTLVPGKNTVTVSSALAGGQQFVWLTVTESGKYYISADNAALVNCIFTVPYAEGDFDVAADGTLGASWYSFSTVADLEAGKVYMAGLYYTGVTAGDYTITLCAHTGGTATCIAQAVCTICGNSYGDKPGHTWGEDGVCTTENCGATKPTEPAPDNKLVVGQSNAIVINESNSIKNALNYYYTVVSFTSADAGSYAFTGTGAACLVYSDVTCATMVSDYFGVATLEAETTYYVAVALSVENTYGTANVTVTYTAPSAGDEVHKNALALGDNEFVVTATQIAQYAEYITITLAEDGKYTFTVPADSKIKLFVFYDKYDASTWPADGTWMTSYPNANNKLTEATAVSAHLQAGTYMVVVNYYYGPVAEGNYNINVAKTGDYDANGNVIPEPNVVVLGNNKYTLTEELLNAPSDKSFEYLTFTAEKAGWYTFTGIEPLTFFIWPDYANTAIGNIPQSAPYVWNVKADNSGFVESFTVYLEAGTYAVGFRFDFATEAGEYDYTISYSETDPNAPAEEPVEELNFFQKIWKAIKDFFASIGSWFKNLIPGKKD